jgi:putative endonuclease
VLSVGVTDDLKRRMFEHRAREIAGLSARHDVERPLFFEQTDDVRSAIAREKQLKGWRRDKKVVLIEADNPSWDELAAG